MSSFLILEEKPSLKVPVMQYAALRGSQRPATDSKETAKPSSHLMCSMPGQEVSLISHYPCSWVIIAMTTGVFSAIHAGH